MDFLEWLDLHEKEMIRFTQQLIRINTVNDNEVEACRLIKKKLRDYGISSKMLGRGKRRNLVAEIGRGGRRLIFSGHTDTVPPGMPKRWMFPPLSGRIHNNKIFGRGAHDMKSGVACLAFAMIALKECGLSSGRLMLLITWGEETGHHGMRAMLRKGLKASAAIVAEPLSSSGGINIGSRGVLRLHLRTLGKAAHSGSLKHRGVNAVTKMAELLLALEKLKPRYKRHRLFPPPRISPGTVIEAGEAVNIIPEICNAQCDCRLSYGQTDKTLLEDVRWVIDMIKSQDPEFRVRIRKAHYVPPTIIDRREPIVKASRNAIRKVMGFDPVLEVSGGVTDGALMVAKGIPSVIFGPHGARLHSENEYIKVKSLVKTAKAYALSAEEFLG